MRCPIRFPGLVRAWHSLLASPNPTSSVHTVAPRSPHLRSDQIPTSPLKMSCHISHLSHLHAPRHAHIVLPNPSADDSSTSLHSGRQTCRTLPPPSFIYSGMYTVVPDLVLAAGRWNARRKWEASGEEPIHNPQPGGSSVCRDLLVLHTGLRHVRVSLGGALSTFPAFPFSSHEKCLAPSTSLTSSSYHKLPAS